MNVIAEQCIHIGDDPIADIQGAGKIGINTIYICRQSKQTKNVEADYIIKNL